jgi:hypothetical protein
LILCGGQAPISTTKILLCGSPILYARRNWTSSYVL